jgi:hypothetical protein
MLRCKLFLCDEGISGCTAVVVAVSSSNEHLISFEYPTENDKGRSGYILHKNNLQRNILVYSTVSTPLMTNEVTTIEGTEGTETTTTPATPLMTNEMTTTEGTERTITYVTPFMTNEMTTTEGTERTTTYVVLLSSHLSSMV